MREKRPSQSYGWDPACTKKFCRLRLVLHHVTRSRETDRSHSRLFSSRARDDKTWRLVARVFRDTSSREENPRCESLNFTNRIPRRERQSDARSHEEEKRWHSTGVMTGGAAAAPRRRERERRFTCAAPCAKSIIRRAATRREGRSMRNIKGY